MELTIERLRAKQRKKLFTKILLITSIIALTTAGIVYFTQQNSTNNSQSKKNNTTKQQTLTHIICIDSSINKELNQFIKDTDLSEATDKNPNTKYTYKTISHSEIQNSNNNCNTIIARNISDATEYERIWSKLYIPVIRFDSLLQNISTAELNDIIQTQILEQNDKTSYAIWDTEITDKFIKSKFKTTTSQAYPDIDSVTKIAKSNNNLIAIIPFENLTPEFKVLNISHKNPTQKEFEINNYPLVDSYWITSENSEIETYLRIDIKKHLGTENYDVTKLHDVLLTGNSTIGARSQQEIIANTKDNLYPIRGILDTIKSAEISHISNGSSFAQNCPQTASTYILCGYPNTIEMLTQSGIDIIGLTGEDIIDAGRPAYENTLNLYKENNIKYFAGGLDYNEAHKPLIIKVGELKLAFIGFNFVAPYNYGATNFRSGNSQYTETIMKADLAKAKKENVDFIFVEMNWGSEYQKVPTTQQIEVAKATLDQGADIITGLNPIYINQLDHQGNKVIFYALGNTLAQPYNEKSRNGIMVRHIFYGNRYLGFELIPTYINEQFQTELARSERKDTILEELFRQSKLSFVDKTPKTEIIQ